MLLPNLQRRRLRVSREPRVIYAIGDVHGCLDKLLALEDLIRADANRQRGVKLILMLGDYVDRGPDSARVIEHLVASPIEGVFRLCISGNHDAAFCDFLAGRLSAAEWIDFAGIATLASYGCDLYEYTRGLRVNERRLQRELRQKIPQQHREFLASLPVAVSMPNFFFAHAGARPGVDLDDQNDHDLLWIRDAFVNQPALFGKTIVHGHTISAEPSIAVGRIGVDTGAYAGGPLTAVRISRGSVDFLSVG